MLWDPRSSRGDSERIQPPLTQIGEQQVICDLVSYCFPLLLQLQKGGSFLPSEPALLEVAPGAASRAQGCWPGAPHAPPRPSCGQGGGDRGAGEPLPRAWVGAVPQIPLQKVGLKPSHPVLGQCPTPPHTPHQPHSGST